MSTNPKREVFASLARVGTALCSPTRIEYLELLAQAERSVEQLATLTGTTIANTSQHLQKLRQAGLIAGRKEGLYVYYRLAGDEVVELLSALGRVGQTYVADVERIVRLYFAQKDALEAVPAKEVLQLARKGLVTVLDVRPSEEFAAGHLPGSSHLELGVLSTAEVSGNTVLMCGHGERAMSAASLLQHGGHRGLAVMVGGPDEWAAATGRALELGR
jgi:DNA-binding transcriptional ArsR family regulator